MTEALAGATAVLAIARDSSTSGLLQFRYRVIAIQLSSLALNSHGMRYATN